MSLLQIACLNLLEDISMRGHWNKKLGGVLFCGGLFSRVSGVEPISQKPVHCG